MESAKAKRRRQRRREAALAAEAVARLSPEWASLPAFFGFSARAAQERILQSSVRTSAENFRKTAERESANSCSFPASADDEEKS